MPTEHLTKIEYIAAWTVALKQGSITEEHPRDPKWQSLQMYSLLRGKDTVQQNRESQNIHHCTWLTAGVCRGQVQAPIVLFLFRARPDVSWMGEPLRCTQNTTEPGRQKWSLCWGCLYFTGLLSLSPLQTQQDPGAGAGEHHTQTRCNPPISLLLINNADKLGQTPLKLYGLVVTQTHYISLFHALTRSQCQAGV